MQFLLAENNCKRMFKEFKYLWYTSHVLNFETMLENNTQTHITL